MTRPHRREDRQCSVFKIIFHGLQHANPRLARVLSLNDVRCLH